MLLLQQLLQLLLCCVTDWVSMDVLFFYFLVNIFLWPFAKLKSHFRMLLYLCSYLLQWREIKSGKPACQLNNNRATNQPFTLSQAHYEIQRPGANKMSSSLYPHKIKSKRDTYLGIKLLNLILLKNIQKKHSFKHTPKTKQMLKVKWSNGSAQQLFSGVT